MHRVMVVMKMFRRRKIHR